ncbi:DNA topoisomerase [Malassezia vespertilionis]|uniref:DNA topoisomerase n=1 Tax=Malassezia vespertilionis TaxID=2020962 RepID=UPI0024B2275C|nr:DNA topoisomerase [Malassezia vespertilionis]WFD06228.1 DNA topoisomerase [Malassezia vespertilionis]
MRVLCVAEKPSIAKSIAQILSGGAFANREGRDKYCRNYDFPYRLPRAVLGGAGARNAQIDVEMTFTSVRGHMMELEFPDEYKWGKCEPSALFTAPTFLRITKDAQKLAQNLTREAQRADMLMIWTDCDREGEQIGHEIVQHCRAARPALRVQRARFSALIPGQIQHAVRTPVELDMNAAYAVEARQQIDLRAGAAFTRLQTNALGRTLTALDGMLISYGPCQFPTLGFVVDHYKRVQAFLPEPFWYIDIQYRVPQFGNVAFHWARKHLFEERIVQTLHKRCRDAGAATVTKTTERPVTKRKPTPLTTVELQKSGSRLFGMAPKRVLDVAEALYQRGLLSYPRTETDQYDKQFDFAALLQKQASDTAWGALALQLLDSMQGTPTEKVRFQTPRNGGKNDKAHPPIHPTMHANGLQGDEKKVYDYVTRRFLGSCATDAEGVESAVDITLGDEQFHASGTIVKALNYLYIFTYESWKDKAMPDFAQGQQFRPTVCEMKKGTTTRPQLLTEADLVSLMDKNGIGTDATIAEHIRKVIDRQYVMRQKQGKVHYLIPSTLGMGLVEGYGKMDASKHLCQPMLRRATEEKLDLVASAALTRDATVQESMSEYKSIFMSIKDNFSTICQSVSGFLDGTRESAAIPGALEQGAECRVPTPAIQHSRPSAQARPYWACANETDGCAKKLQARTGDNAGRYFYCCPKESQRANMAARAENNYPAIDSLEYNHEYSSIPSSNLDDLHHFIAQRSGLPKELQNEKSSMNMLGHEHLGAESGMHVNMQGEVMHNHGMRPDSYPINQLEMMLGASYNEQGVADANPLYSHMHVSRSSHPQFMGHAEKHASSHPQPMNMFHGVNEPKAYAPPLDTTAITPASVFSTISSTSTNDFLSPLTSPALQPQTSGHGNVYGMHESDQLLLQQDLISSISGAPPNNLVHGSPYTHHDASTVSLPSSVGENYVASTSVSPALRPERKHNRRNRSSASQGKASKVRPSPLMKPAQSPKVEPIGAGSVSVWQANTPGSMTNAKKRDAGAPHASPSLGALESLSSTMQETSGMTMPGAFSPISMGVFDRVSSRGNVKQSRSRGKLSEEGLRSTVATSSNHLRSNFDTNEGSLGYTHSPSPVNLGGNAQQSPQKPVTPGAIIGIMNNRSPQAAPIHPEHNESMHISRSASLSTPPPADMYPQYKQGTYPSQSAAVNAVAASALMNASHARPGLFYHGAAGNVPKPILPGGLSSEDRHAWMNLRRVGTGGLDQRRSSHKAAEQKRRDSLKHCFDELRCLLPMIVLDENAPGGSVLGPDGTKEDQVTEGFEDTVSFEGGDASREGAKSSLASLSPEQAHEANRAIAKVLLLRHSNEYLVRLKRRIERRDQALHDLSEEVVRLRSALGVQSDMPLHHHAAKADTVDDFESLSLAGAARAQPGTEHKAYQDDNATPARHGMDLAG